MVDYAKGGVSTEINKKIKQQQKITSPIFVFYCAAGGRGGGKGARIGGKAGSSQDSGVEGAWLSIWSKLRHLLGI